MKNLNSIEIAEEPLSDGYYHAKMVSKAKKASTEKNEGSDAAGGEVIAIIKADERVTLQMIKISLEEAQQDNKEIGRPLTFTVHDGHYLSLLSEKP